MAQHLFVDVWLQLVKRIIKKIFPDRQDVMLNMFNYTLIIYQKLGGMRVSSEFSLDFLAYLSIYVIKNNTHKTLHTEVVKKFYTNIYIKVS